ncbi:MAG: antibiotic biosynthesis monooxygenase family protein [Longimicrobiales bacterium]
MIVEYVRYTIPQERSEAFEAAYARARESLDASPECLGYELSRCTEDASSYVLRIEWESVEAHLEGFRKGSRFRAFFAEIRPFVSDIAEMRHYALTAVVARKEEKEISR